MDQYVDTLITGEIFEVSEERTGTLNKYKTNVENGMKYSFIHHYLYFYTVYVYTLAHIALYSTHI